MSEIRSMRKKLDEIDTRLRMVMQNLSLDYNISPVPPVTATPSIKQPETPSFINSAFERVFEKLEDLDYRIQKIEKSMINND